MKIVLLLALALVIPLTAQPKVVAYSYGTSPTTSDYDYSKITHLVASFVKSDAQGNLLFDDWVPESHIIALLRKVEAQGVVPMIAFGTTADGWLMTKSKTARTHFIDNILAWCDSVGVEGIDLDLEAGPADFLSDEYDSLATELRAAMADTMILTSAVAFNSYGGASWTDHMVAQLNWINVMIYDIALTWPTSPVTNHSSWENHLEAAAYWHGTRGLAKERIIMGLPFYAHGWDIDNNKMYEEDAGWGNTGSFDYKHFVDKFSLAADLDSFELAPTQTIQYSRLDSLEGKAQIFYNGQDLIARKTQWTVDGGFGGVMIWHLSADVPTTQSNSLLRAIDSVINPSSPLVPQDSKQQHDPLSLRGSFQNITLSGLTLGENYTVEVHSVSGKQLQKPQSFSATKKSSTIEVKGYVRSGVSIITVKSTEGAQTFPLRVR